MLPSIAGGGAAGRQYAVAIVGMGSVGWTFAARLAGQASVALTLYTRQETLDRHRARAAPGALALRALVNDMELEFGRDFAVRAWDAEFSEAVLSAPPAAAGAGTAAEKGTTSGLGGGQAASVGSHGARTAEEGDTGGTVASTKRNNCYRGSAELLGKDVLATQKQSVADNEMVAFGGAPKHDVVIVTTKAQFLHKNAHLLRAVRAMLRDESAALVLAQNGVPFWYTYGCGDPRLEGREFAALHAAEIAAHWPIQQVVGMVLRVVSWEDKSEAPSGGIVVRIRHGPRAQTTFWYGSAMKTMNTKNVHHGVSDQAAMTAAGEVGHGGGSTSERCSTAIPGRVGPSASTKLGGTDPGVLAKLVTVQEELLERVFSLADVGEAVRVGHIRHQVWLKLLRNASMNPLGVLSELPMQASVLAPEGEAVAARIIEEIMQLYEKLRFVPSMSVTIDGDLGDHYREVLPLLGVTSAAEGLEVPKKNPPEFKVSTLQDFEAGQSLEIEALLDAVLEVGQAVCAELPTLDVVTKLVKLRCLQRGLDY